MDLSFISKPFLSFDQKAFLSAIEDPTVADFIAATATNSDAVFLVLSKVSNELIKQKVFLNSTLSHQVREKAYSMLRSPSSTGILIERMSDQWAQEFLCSRDSLSDKERVRLLHNQALSGDSIRKVLSKSSDNVIYNFIMAQDVITPNLSYALDHLSCYDHLSRVALTHSSGDIKEFVSNFVNVFNHV